jgi:hypothetical protein
MPSPNRQYWARGSFVPLNAVDDIASLDLGKIVNGNTFTDRSGNSNDGTIAGSLLTAFTSVGPALQFQGNGNVNVNTMAADISPTVGYVELVVQIFDATGSQYFFSSNSNVRDHVWITGGTLQYQRGNPGVSISAGAPTARAICHLVGQYNNGAMEFFVDGVSVGTDTFLDTSQATLVSIGDFRNTGSSRVLNSNVLYLRRGNVILSDAEIGNRYQSIANTVLFHETWELSSVTASNATTDHSILGTSWYVESGEWKVVADGSRLVVECVSAGTIVYQGVDDSDTWTVRTFEQVAGAPTLNRLIDRLEIDGTAGDKVGEILLTVG